MWLNLRECEKMVAHEDRGLARRTRLGGCLEAGECVFYYFLGNTRLTFRYSICKLYPKHTTFR